MDFKEFENTYRHIWKVSTVDNPNIEFAVNCPNVDISKTKYEFVYNPLYAIWWFQKNGFTAKIVKDNSSGTEFVVSKEGTDDTFRLTSTMWYKEKCDIVSYMQQFEKSFKMKQEIERLREQVKVGKI